MRYNEYSSYSCYSYSELNAFRRIREEEAERKKEERKQHLRKKMNYYLQRKNTRTLIGEENLLFLD